MFDERLKIARRKANTKQVAEALNMKPRTYSSYENNEREPNLKFYY
ncbi:MAG: helix-turn-helix domain-containing protein [Clostridia bacterium]